MDDNTQAEVAKEVVKQVAKPIQDFIGTVFGKPAKELGAWVADGIRGKRFETQVKIFTKSKYLLDKAGLGPNAVNIKLLVPLLDGGSLEDEDDLVSMWAHLLANASISINVRSSYIAILKELEPVEARIMQYIYQEFVKAHGQNYAPKNEYAGSIDGDTIKNAFKLSLQDFEQAIDNLYRVRLLAPTATRLEFITDKETPLAHYSKHVLGVTYLGFYFARSCNSIHVIKN